MFDEMNYNKPFGKNLKIITLNITPSLMKFFVKA